MATPGANAWSVPLEINNLESQISGGGGGGVQSVSVGNSNLTLSGTPTNPILSGTLTALTSNVATTNFAFSGNTVGNPSFVIGGGEEFKIITTDLTPHILVDSSVSGGVQLGLPSGYGGYKVTAPTVTNPATSDDQVATTAFVQSVIGATPDLSTVLISGNTAGATDIDLNSQDLLSVNNITVASPYNFSVVSIFADATARDLALPSPYAGQMAFLTGSNKLQFWNTNWGNVSVILNNPVITGFTLTTQYELIFVNASNAVITAPTLGGFTIVRFFPTTTTSGTITLPSTASVQYLLVAGGGGGGGGTLFSSNAGGGGGGGFVTATDLMVELTSYALTVGGGGIAGVASTNGGLGANSSLVVDSGTITANGGGGGGTGVGVAGGSGGGGGYTGVVNAGGAGSQGSAGGSSTTVSPYPFSGGGGGAGGVGSSSVGQGGVGLSSTITGATVFYAGGGGGGASAGAPSPPTLPTGGNGGGGNGGYFNNIPPFAGTNGRGGGGGGRGNTTGASGAAGGSGIVIVRFPSYS